MDQYTQPLITIGEIMNVMNERKSDGEYKPFSISFFTCDLSRRTGGKLVKFNKAKRSFLKADAKKLHLVGVTSLDSSDGHVTSVHLPLIHEFNGKLAVL